MAETSPPDLAQQARDVLDEVRYVVLGTIDEDGRPRTSPVYFTPHRHQDLYWVSHPDTHHSARPPGPRDRARPAGAGGPARVTGLTRGGTAPA